MINHIKYVIAARSNALTVSNYENPKLSKAELGNGEFFL